MPTKKNKVVNNHMFRGCREVFVTTGAGAAPGATPASLSTDAGGNGGFTSLVCPLGLTSVTISTGGSLFLAGTTGNISKPPLRGLYNRALDFQWYRIVRAKFVFVSSQGSTVTGFLTLAAYSDPLDVADVTFNTNLSSLSTRAFDLASGATKELSVPVPVDTSWKKCSSILTVPGNVVPFSSANASSFTVVNSVSDLCCGAVTAYLQGGPGSQPSVGSFYLDYDVEFKGVIDSAVNR